MLIRSVACRVVGVTDACDHPKEAASRHKVVRCSSGDALDRERERPGSLWTVDADMLSREGPGLVLASDSGHACPADAHAVAEVHSSNTPYNRIPFRLFQMAESKAAFSQMNIIS